MTYCVAIKIDAGICYASDSRTNAGVDNISTYSKMFTFSEPNNRQITVLSAGNLATTQAVIGQIKRDVKRSAKENVLTMDSLEEIAEYVGQINIAQQERHSGGNVNYAATFIVGGQIIGQKHQVFLVYSAGNYITTSKDTPYLQIGESKYGKPILDRIIASDTTMETAARCALVSMDSTMRSNLTVGPPIEVLMYERDSLSDSSRFRFEEDSDHLRQIHSSWDAKLKEAFNSMPGIDWEELRYPSADAG